MGLWIVFPLEYRLYVLRRELEPSIWGFDAQERQNAQYEGCFEHRYLRRAYSNPCTIRESPLLASCYTNAGESK